MKTFLLSDEGAHVNDNDKNSDELPLFLNFLIYLFLGVDEEPFWEKISNKFHSLDPPQSFAVE